MEFLLTKEKVREIFAKISEDLKSHPEESWWPWQYDLVAALLGEFSDVIKHLHLRGLHDTEANRPLGEYIIRLDRVLDAASHILFADRHRIAFFALPDSRFDNRRPIDMLRTEEGFQKVMGLIKSIDADDAPLFS